MKAWAFFTVLITVSLSLIATALYLTGFLGIPQGIVLIGYLLILIWWLRNNKPKIKHLVKDWLGFILFTFLAVVALSSFTYRQSISDQTGLTIQTYNKHDALWHLGLMESLSHGSPPNLSILDGERIQSYHYFSDIIWSNFHLLTKIPLTTIYLFIAPWFLAALFAATTLLVFNKVIGDKIESYLVSSLVVFGAGFAYLVPFFSPNSPGEQSVFWLEQSVHYGINHQLLLSLSVFNVVLFLLFSNVRKNWWLIGLLVGSLAGIKVYASMMILPALLVTALILLLNKKAKNRFHWLGAFITAAALTATILSLAGNAHGGWPFIWSPGWFFSTMFKSGQHLAWDTWELQRQVFALDHNWLRLIIHWTVAAAIFFTGNFGVKILGVLAPLIILWRLKVTKSLTKTDSRYPQLMFWVAMVSGCFIFISLFIQKGTVWNTIQSLHYAQVPLALLFAWTLRKIIAKSSLRIGILVAALIISLPTTAQTIYLNSQASSYFNYSADLVNQLSELRYISSEKKLVVGSGLNNNSLVPALSGRAAYWANPDILNILGQDSPEREDRVLSIEQGIENCNLGELYVTLTPEGVQTYDCPLTIFAHPKEVPNLQ